MADTTTKKKVQHNVTQVEATTNTKEELLATTKKNATPYRIGAFVFWFLALACEVMAVLFFAKKIPWALVEEDPGYTISWIAALVLDLVFLIIGSSLWKKANHTNPASAKNKTAFWLQNNLGVIVAAVAFIPFVILALTNKDADKKSKTIAGIVAAAALAIGTLFGIDWNPVSQEEMLENAGIDTVYWTEGGSVFHLTQECSHLDRSIDLLSGTSTAAIEAGKTRVCKTCERKAEAGELAEAGKEHEDTVKGNVDELLDENEGAADDASEDAAD